MMHFVVAHYITIVIVMIAVYIMMMMIPSPGWPKVV